MAPLISAVIMTVVFLILAVIRDYPECKREIEEEIRKQKMKKAKVHRVDASKIVWVKKNGY